MAGGPVIDVLDGTDGAPDLPFGWSYAVAYSDDGARAAWGFAFYRNGVAHYSRDFSSAGEAAAHAWAWAYRIELAEKNGPPGGGP